MQIEPWQIPVLAMAALALPPSVHWLVTWVREKSGGTSSGPEPDAQRPTALERARREKLRATILAILTVVLVGLFILALGPAAASILTSVASAVSALVSAVMTVQSYLTLVAIRRDISRGPEPAPIESSEDGSGRSGESDATTS
jgi:hypothetical protein